MKELLIRSVSGLVMGLVLLCSVWLSPWAYAAVLLFIVFVGTSEMSKLMQTNAPFDLIMGEAFSIVSFVLAALVALGVVPMKWLSLELLFLVLPFLYALFSKTKDAKHVLTYVYASLFFLCLPSAMMLFMFWPEWFGDMAGKGVIILIYCLLWSNDIFAYLTGRLLGKHKLFPRISPGKTIEGSIGGLLFTVIAVAIFSHYAEWLSLPAAVGMAAIAVVFGTLGDLSESMLKRQAGVKDSGKLIPGHGGILDRFDSVMFSVPFIFVYLLLL